MRKKKQSNARANGIPLRDWFAGQALAGMLASPPVIDRSDPEQVNHIGWAVNAYRFADAMLAARDNTENDDE